MLKFFGWCAYLFNLLSLCLTCYLFDIFIPIFIVQKRKSSGWGGWAAAERNCSVYLGHYPLSFIFYVLPFIFLIFLVKFLSSRKENPLVEVGSWEKLFSLSRSLSPHYPPLQLLFQPYAIVLESMLIWLYPFTPLVWPPILLFCHHISLLIWPRNTE